MTSFETACALAPEVEQAGLALWRTKEEAAVLLGCSPKSIERYAKDGRISHMKRPNPGKSPNVVYNPEDLERLRVELAPGVALLPPISTAPKSQVVAFEPQFAATLERLLEAVVTQPRQIAEATAPLPKYVSLAGAVKLSGLSAQTIKDLAAPGNAAIKTMPFGRGVRYRRADLEKL